MECWQCLEGGDWKRKYGKRKYRGMEYASTEYVSTNMQGWKTQVRKTQVRICNGGKRKYSNLKIILKSLRFSSLAFSVDPLSVGLDQFTCTVPNRCHTQEIGLMLAGLVRRRAWVQKSQARRCLRQTVYTHCTSSSKIVSSPLKGCEGNCRPGGK